MSKKLRMLIVEDERTSQELMKHYLTPLGSFDLAEDGKQALDAIRSAFEKEQPYDLVFLDIRMPGIDGQSALKELRRIEADHSILGQDGCKVVMTSVANDARTIISSFKNQCEAYLVKPFTKEQLYDQIRKLGINLTGIVE